MVKLWCPAKSGLKNHNIFFMVSSKIRPEEPWWLSMCPEKSGLKNNDTYLPSTHLKEGHLLIRSSPYNRYLKTYVNERSSPSMTYTHQLNDASEPPYQLNDITHPCDKLTSITLKIHITRSYGIKSWSIFYKSRFITVCI